MASCIHRNGVRGEQDGDDDEGEEARRPRRSVLMSSLPVLIRPAGRRLSSGAPFVWGGEKREKEKRKKKTMTDLQTGRGIKTCND